jgi:hypothetical protein
MFREFGYRYILSPAASVIRDIVSSYEKCPTEIGKFVGQVGGEPERFGTPLQLLKIQGGVAIMVVMALLTETRRYYAAFMPRDVDADGKVEHQWFDNFYFVMGYPASRNQSDTNHRRKKIHVKSFHLATNPPPGDPFQKEKLSRAEHLLVEFDHNETVVERKKVVPPKLQGVSGGGIFCISRSSNTGPLVAIATEHRKRSSILVGTRVRYFVQVARELARTEPLEIFE